MTPKKIVLLVERDEASLSVHRFMLQTRGYRPLGVTSAKAALAILQAREGSIFDPRHSVAALIVVVERVAEGVDPPSKPDIDGLPFVRMLRDFKPPFPILLFSSTLASGSIAHQADAFVGKDGSLADLLQHLRRLTARKPGPRKQSHAKPIQSVTLPADKAVLA